MASVYARSTYLRHGTIARSRNRWPTNNAHATVVH